MKRGRPARPPRLAIFSHGYHPGIGGAETLVRRIAEGLVAAHGFQATVHTPNTFDPGGFVDSTLPRIPVAAETIAGVAIQRYPVVTAATNLLRVLVRLQPENDYLRLVLLGPISPSFWWHTRRPAADLILATAFPYLPMYHALAAGARTGIPVALLGCYHLSDTLCFNRAIQDRALARASLYIANTGAEEHHLRQRCPTAKIVTISPGVDAPAAHPHEPPGDKMRLLFVGQVHERKRLAELLALFSRLVAVQRAPRTVTLTVLCPRRNSELARAVAGISPEAAAGLTIRTELTDAEIAAAHGHADYFITLATAESFGIAPAEALAHGLPLICSAAAGQFSFGSAALALGDELLAQPDALDARLRNPDQYQQLRAGGQEWVAAHSWPDSLARYAACLRQLL